MCFKIAMRMEFLKLRISFLLSSSKISLCFLSHWILYKSLHSSWIVTVVCGKGRFPCFYPVPIKCCLSTVDGIKKKQFLVSPHDVNVGGKIYDLNTLVKKFVKIRKCYWCDDCQFYIRILTISFFNVYLFKWYKFCV